MLTEYDRHRLSSNSIAPQVMPVEMEIPFGELPSHQRMANWCVVRWVLTNPVYQLETLRRKRSMQQNPLMRGLEEGQWHIAIVLIFSFYGAAVVGAPLWAGGFIGILITMLLVHTTLLCAMSAGGDRSGGQLEQLIITPLSRWHIIIGKAAAHSLPIVRPLAFSFPAVIVVWLGCVGWPWRESAVVSASVIWGLVYATATMFRLFALLVEGCCMGLVMGFWLGGTAQRNAIAGACACGWVIASILLPLICLQYVHYSQWLIIFLLAGWLFAGVVATALALIAVYKMVEPLAQFTHAHSSRSPVV